MKLHQGLTSGRWQKLNIFEQMANIDAEIGRTLNWRDKSPADSTMTFERALELLDLTIADPKNRNSLKELLRLRETLTDYFVFDNQYSSSKSSWENYFYAFNYAARINKSSEYI